MELHPHAKINLGLLIKGKREDGYHLLETLLYPIHHLHDRLVLKKSGATNECQLRLEGTPLDGNPEDNLVVKAYRLLQQQLGDLPGVEITLEKHIPAGAGLGGGSSDAAFTLSGLNELLELGLSVPQLAEIGAHLGTDVPFFFFHEPMLATGIGSSLERFPLPLPYRIELVTPKLHSSTAEAYQSLDTSNLDPDRRLRELLAKPVSAWKDCLPNDLEGPVMEKYPKIRQEKDTLYKKGAVYAAMSGSGSACFGLFES